jgi:hypothetical protein
MASQFPAYNSFGAGVGNYPGSSSSTNSERKKADTAQQSQSGYPDGLVDWGYFFGDAYWGTFGINPWQMLGNLNASMDPMMAAIKRDFGIG